MDGYIWPKPTHPEHRFAPPNTKGSEVRTPRQRFVLDT